MLRVEFDPLEVMAMLPLTVPAAAGANFTVNEVLWPALNVRGRVRPL